MPQSTQGRVRPRHRPPSTLPQKSARAKADQVAELFILTPGGGGGMVAALKFFGLAEAVQLCSITGDLNAESELFRQVHCGTSSSGCSCLSVRIARERAAGKGTP
jgi:hypothetical protein